MTELGAPRPATLPVMPATAAVCPYLLSSDGGWRASTPAREHRCTVVTPPAILAPDKQRRLCLSADHASCSTYMAAVADAEGALDVDHGGIAPHGRRPTREVTRTAPLVLDHGARSIGLPGLPTERGAGQSGLVALMGVAFAAIVIARLSGGGPDLTPAARGVAVSPSATRSAAATVKPASTVEPAPTHTLVPTEVEPTPAPGKATPAPGKATPAPGKATPAPTAATTPASYKVKSGDTLGGIARSFGTTVKVLMELNGIDDPRRLRTGQVLDLP